MKLTQSNQNITIGSKNMDWVRSFVSGPNWCIVSFPTRIGTLEQPRRGFRHSNETDPIEPKQRLFCFKTESVHRFISGPNRCTECNIGIDFGTVTKLTQNKSKHHY